MRWIPTACFLFCSVASIQAADPMPIDPLWKSKAFQNAVTGSYGIDSRIEPQISVDEEEYLRDAAELLADGKRDEVIALFETASILEKSPAMRFSLANLQFENGDSDPAIENFEKTIEQFPNFRDAHRNLALALVREEKYDDAKEHLVRAIELGSNEGLTFGLLGYCHAVDEHHQAALQSYRLAQLTMPQERQWILGEAQALQALDQPEPAASLYRQVLAEEPAETQIWLSLANTVLQTGDETGAIAAMEIVRHMQQLDPAGLVSLGHLYLNQELPAEALTAYEQALAKQENRASLAQCLEALTYLTDREYWKEARAFLGLVRGAYPEADSPELVRAGALIEFQTGNRAAAEIQVQELINSDPMDGLALILMAHFHREQERREEAEMLLEQAALLPDFEVAALTAHGKLLALYREYEEAAKKLERALKLQPSDTLRQYLEAVRDLVN